MTYLTDEEMYELPDDPGEGFVAGEKIMRDRLSEALLGLSEDSSTVFLTQDYMNNVIALADHLRVDEIAQWQNARPGHHDWMEYRQFVADVDACTMRMRLQKARRTREYSVSLNAATKSPSPNLLSPWNRL